MEWFGGAEPLARASQWVRRASWSDLTQQMRFEAGAQGTTYAVLVVSTSATSPRAVLNSEFGEAEFRANDWTLADASAASAPIDLTAARLSLVTQTGAEWALFRENSGAQDTPAGDGTGGSGGIGTPSDAPSAPASGDAVLMSHNGQTLWVPVQEFACPI